MQSFTKKCVNWQDMTTFVKIFATNSDNVFYIWFFWAICRLKCHKYDCDLFFKNPWFLSDVCTGLCLTAEPVGSDMYSNVDVESIWLSDFTSSQRQWSVFMHEFFFACVGYSLKQRTTVIFSSKAEFSLATWLNLLLPEHRGKSPTYCTHSSRLLPL